MTDKTDRLSPAEDLLARLEAAVAAHEAEETQGKHDHAAFARYADDPVGFAEDVLGVEYLWKSQVEFLEAFVDQRRVTVRGGVGVGKDFAGAAALLWWILARDGFGIVTSGVEDQLTRQIFRGELRRHLDRAGDRIQGVDLYRDRLDVNGRTRAIAVISTEAGRLTGYHAPRILAWASEAHSVPAYAFEALKSCAVGEDDRYLYTGNPITVTGEFYRSHRPSSGWKAFRWSALDHPNIVEGRIVIPGGPSRIWLQDRLEDAGGDQDNPFFRARVLAEWIEAETGSLTTRDLLEQAVAANLEPGVRVTAALDPSGSGPDQSMVCLLRFPVVIKFIPLPRRTSTLATAEDFDSLVLRRFVEKPGSSGGDPMTWGDPFQRLSFPGIVVVDSVGLGEGVASRVSELGYSVVRFKSQGRAPNPETHLNARAYAYDRVRKLLENGAIKLPNDEALFEELLATKWSVTAAGKLALAPKDDIKAELGRSPDRADALAMAVSVHARTFTSQGFAFTP